LYNGGLAIATIPFVETIDENFDVAVYTRTGVEDKDGKRVGLMLSRRLPVFPNQRTSEDRPDWSVSCH